MRMLIRLVIGLGALAAAVIFCDPLRQKVEEVLLSEKASPRQHAAESARRPLADMAGDARKALGEAWSSAAEFVGSGQQSPTAPSEAAEHSGSAEPLSVGADTPQAAHAAAPDRAGQHPEEPQGT